MNMSIEEAQDILLSINTRPLSDRANAIRMAYRALAAIDEIKQVPLLTGRVEKILVAHGWREE